MADSGKQPPIIIGHPGYQSSPDGFTKSMGCTSQEQIVDRSLQQIYMTPLDTKITKSINIYEGRNAVGEYQSYATANGVSNVGEYFDGSHLTVAVNNLTPLAETYQNEFGQSELFGAMQNITSGGLQEAAFMTGYNGQADLKKWAERDDFVGTLAKGANGLVETAGKTAQSLGMSEHNANTLKQALSNPTQKIDIPQMWKGNSFNAQYEISIRLQCFNVNDDSQYIKYIVNPVILMMQFTCPRSKTGDFYQWPFLMEFEIPGLVDLPLAYASNLTVIKGGDVNDLSWQWRPNVVDLRMTINTVWGVAVNVLESSSSLGSKPTLKKEHGILSKKRGISTDSSTENESARSEAEAASSKGGETGRNSVPSSSSSDAASATKS